MRHNERVLQWNDGVRPLLGYTSILSVLCIVPVLGDEPQNKNDACRWARLKTHRSSTAS